MKSFNKKIIVITGAGSGMGREYALAFAALGADLALNDYDNVGLEETVALVRQRNPYSSVFYNAFDVGSKEAMYHFAAEVKSTLGNAHVVINNAGVGGGGDPVWVQSEDVLERTMRINFYGVAYGTRAFLPQLIANNEGAIVNISSIFGFVGMPNNSDYCASKFAVRGFTESLMVELQGSGISVHCVHPGGINTNIAKDAENGEEFTARFLITDPAEVVRVVIRKIQKKEPRIVYGNQAFKVWLSSWALSTQRRVELVHREMRDLFNPQHYGLLRK